MKHTPTPWGFDGDGFDSVSSADFDSDGYCIFPIDKDGNPTGHICDLSEQDSEEQSRETAAFIVRAANNFEVLLDALAKAQKSLETISDALLFEDGQCVTSLEAREIEIIYNDSIQHLVVIQAALTKAEAAL